MKINYPLLALAIGTLDIGTTEFSPMGLLPVVARGVDVSIPAAGMLINAYVVGVIVGAPLMTLLLSHRAHHSALVFLMATSTLDNVLSTIVPDYMTLMLSRTLISLNHGVFFGLGSAVAASAVPEHKQASAVVTMFVGLTLANISGMPAAAWLGETIGWRTSFLTAAGLDVISMISPFFSLPKDSAGARPEMKRELAVLMRPRVLSVLLTTVLGVGTMFTLYIYISLVLQGITHITPVFVTAMLVLIGVRLSIGNYLGGKLADRSVSGTLKGFLLLLMVTMLVIPFLARNEFGVAISVVAWGAATFTVMSSLQMRVMRVASETPGLSLSVNIGAPNLGNTLGAAAGDAVIPAGLGYSFVPVMRAIVAGLALSLMSMSIRKQPETVCVADS